MIIQKKVQVRCKKCGGFSSPDDFILDHFYGTVVCKNCAKSKSSPIVLNEKPAVEEAPKQEVRKKPSGWDREDDMLEKAYAAKIKDTTFCKRVDNDHVSYQCQKCGYQFHYNLIKKYPARCPACCTDVGRIRAK